MDPVLYNSSLTVDLGLLRGNIRSLLSLLPPDGVMIPVLKCNAYGMGLIPVAKVLQEFPQIKTFAVAQVLEGVQLRKAGCTREILVFGGVLPRQLAAAVEFDLTVTAGRLGLVPLLAGAAKEADKPAQVHIKLETGLNRVGICPGEELAALIQELKEAAPWVSVSGTYSHFADAEGQDRPRSEAQAALFAQGLSQLEQTGIDPGCRHLSNSAASEWFPQGNYDAVRLGRRLYMDSQDAPTGLIQEIATFQTYITHLRQLPKGARLGYGQGYTLTQDTRVAIIGAGYGDGVSHQAVSNHCPALVGGRRASFLACCMDQSFLDVTGIPCQVGDPVTLFGYDEAGTLLSSQEVARYANDEGCGLTAALSPRVLRIYKD